MARRFALFATLLATALLLHQLWWNGFELTSWRAVAAFAALWVLCRPGSVVRFLLMLGAEVVSVGLDMPAVHSHTLLVLVLGASVLAYAAASTFRARRLPDGEALFAAIAPFLRASVILVYAAAALAKMNDGFLDAGLSCAASLTAQIAWFDPSLLDAAWLAGPAIAGTLLVEVSLPALLAFPRTRLAGLLLGIGFHGILALAGNVPFSALMLGLYVAFLPAGLPERAPAALPRVAFPLLAAGWVAGAAAQSLEPAAVRGLILDGTRPLVLLMAVAAALLLLRGRRAAGVRSGGLAPGHPALAAGLAVLLLNAMSPYVGLKTESSFAMFSNLRTEAGLWNHALIPESVRVFGFQDELLEARGPGGTRLVRYEAERRSRALDGAATPLDRVMKFRSVRRPADGC